MSQIKLIAISGSLRKGSYNSNAVRFLQKELPENVSLELLDISQVPLLNEDDEKKPLPESVLNLKDKIAEADGVIFATPEYNYSIPPALKNAIDWASRGKNLWSDKPVAIFSASLGMLGGSRVQSHLRQVALCLNMRALNKPEVFIGSAHTKFDKEGNLTDATTQDFLKRLLAELVKEVENQRKLADLA